MSPMTVIVISVIITILVLWASVWVVVKGYAYKHTVDTDDMNPKENFYTKQSNQEENNDKA